MTSLPSKSPSKSALCMFPLLAISAGSTLFLSACAECPAGTLAIGGGCVTPDDGGLADAEPNDAGAEDTGPVDAAGREDAGPPAACSTCSASEFCFEDTCQPTDACSPAFAVPCSVFGPAYLKASVTDAQDEFASRVAVSGDGQRMVVSAKGEDGGNIANPTDDSRSASGAVYVFRRAGGEWVEEAYLKASNLGAEDDFGSGLAIDGDGSTIVVGARAEDSAAGAEPSDNSAETAGAAYVFTRVGTMWTQTAMLKASNGETYDQFGHTVAVSEDGQIAAVSAIWEGKVGMLGDPGDGAVYVFQRNGSIWSETDYLKPSTSGANDIFGSGISMSADGTTIAIAAQWDDGPTNGEVDAGAVYVFSGNGTSWSQQAVLRADIPEAGEWFGLSLSLSGDGGRLAVSAPRRDETSLDAGRVFVFDRNGTNWMQTGSITPTTAGAEDWFGHSVSLSADGRRLVAGAHLEDTAGSGIQSGAGNNSLENSGAVFVFDSPGTSWSQTAFIKASNPDSRDAFGARVSVSADGRWMVVGASGESSNGAGSDRSPGNNSLTSSGAAYAYRIGE